jgi:hypothetical protein
MVLLEIDAASAVPQVQPNGAPNNSDERSAGGVCEQAHYSDWRG